MKPAVRELALADALAELEALPTPEGMDPGQWSTLRATLSQQLSNIGISRWVSAAPTGEANAVNDLYLTKVDDFTATAHWTYRNVGDYDQNSEANISDVTALGVNLGKTSAAADWAKVRVCDGDENGEVNISDLTPLGVHLLSTVDAYAIEMSFSPEIAESWVELAVVPLTAASPANDGPRTFFYDVPAVAGQSFRVVPRHGTLRGVSGLPYSYDGTGGPPPMDPILRQQVLDAIAEKIGNLTATTSEGQDEEIAQFIASQPGIVGTGHEDGVISGQFEDGRGIVVFKNLGTPDTAASSVRAAAGWQSPVNSIRRSSISLPTKKKALLLDGFTDQETPEVKKMVEATRLAFKADGTYELVEEPLTVDNYRDLVRDDVGVLIAAGHGGIWTVGARQFFILATSTLQSPELDNQYANDFAHGALDYAFVAIEGGGAQKRYCLTENFMIASPIVGDNYDNEISLAAEALVFLPGCSGGSLKSGDFHKALFDCGAAVVIGWDRVVYTDQAADAAGQFFDGVLGTTTAPGSIQDPPQRPFFYGDVMGDMASRGVSAGVPVIYPPGRMSYLKEYFSTSATFDDGAGQLLPTISRMEVDEPNHQMYLNGDFGGTMPEVLVTGVPLTVDVFNSPHDIFMHLDFSTGPQSMGYVQVSVDGRLSNKRLLSSWKGNVIFEQTGPGSLHREVSCFVHFRADLDTWRNSPGNVPPLGGMFQTGITFFRLAPDSNSFVSCGGSYFDSDSDVMTTWSDAEVLILPIWYPEDGGVPPSVYLDGYGNFDMSQNLVYLNLSVAGFVHEKRVYTPDQEVQLDEDVPFTDQVALRWPPSLQMTIDPVSWDIQEGQTAPVVEGDVTYKVRWETIPCETGGPLLPVWSR